MTVNPLSGTTTNLGAYNPAPLGLLGLDAPAPGSPPAEVPAAPETATFVRLPAGSRLIEVETVPWGFACVESTKRPSASYLKVVVVCDTAAPDHPANAMLKATRVTHRLIGFAEPPPQATSVRSEPALHVNQLRTAPRALDPSSTLRSTSIPVPSNFANFPHQPRWQIPDQKYSTDRLFMQAPRRIIRRCSN